MQCLWEADEWMNGGWQEKDGEEEEYLSSCHKLKSKFHWLLSLIHNITKAWKQEIQNQIFTIKMDKLGQQAVIMYFLVSTNDCGFEFL